MARNGMARLRHYRHRDYLRVRRQHTLSKYLADESARLSLVGDPDFQDDFTVNTGPNHVNFGSAHGLSTDEKVYRLTNAGGALPAGLAEDTPYWVSVVNATTVQLLDDFGGSVVPISSTGTGTHTMTSVAGVGPDNRIVEYDAPNILRVEYHGLRTGDGPYHFLTSGALPQGIVAGELYYPRVIDEDTFELTTKKREAKSLSPVAITSAGSGIHVMRRYVTTPESVMAWHDRRRSERVSASDVDQL